jgi:hypothetical protein
VSNANRVLLKLRPSAGLAAADPRANLRPLHDTPKATPTFGFTAAPAWYIADLPDGADRPWDMAHSQVARQLGIEASDLLFAEPDLLQNIFPDTNEVGMSGQPFAVGEQCTPFRQDAGGNRATGPGFAWHLGDDFSQLGTARTLVEFTDPRTRIAHIDTGYDRNHQVRPAHIRQDLERNFVDDDDNPTSAHDPNNPGVFDNSGHGTGTCSILAGGRVAEFDVVLGGAPEAEIVPLRIADRVILFRTSALAQALRYAVEQRCDVVSISMGGLPSRAWSEAVNEAYEAGICIVAAAGNNVNGLVTRHVVYPARYRRVIAACGVMADGRPYANLSGLRTLEGNFGPESSMRAAIAAYTPNIPWAVFGCGTIVRQNGEGTSAATPQVAAAVALWYEKYKGILPRNWQRVEAVRHALFESARKGDAEHFGHGTLRAHAALERRPVFNLPRTEADRDSFSFFRVITGLGIAEMPPREQMLNLELTQRWLLNKELQALVPDPENPPQGMTDDGLREFRREIMEAIIEDKDASLSLRKHVAGRYPLVTGVNVKHGPPEVMPPATPACSQNISIPDPPFRRVRVYAADPSFSTHLETAHINEVVLKIRWEKLEKPGPVGEYLEVIDTDASGITYDPVDLDEPRLLAQDGWAPSEGNPAFHQQMVYAVAMKTIEHFESALGRPVLWRPATVPGKPSDDSLYVPRMRVYPHALRQANAFYSPEKAALLFGYFEASGAHPGQQVPGSRVYSCLSHDIIAHETTHAILDGMHRRFNEPTNLDVLALHEAFADIVALMQHFTIPEVLESQISRTRGDLESESTLGSLAIQFGQARGGRAALREAIGHLNEKGEWVRLKPDPAELQNRITPHARGAILVAAVFDAFLAIYKSRTADLLRIYTGGTGVLPSGAIHPDLVRRLADEAAKSARHVLNMCIRALDYLPPVDVTFGEYLRAIITADFDLVGDDEYNYRVAFVEAFRSRGIYPNDLETLSVDTLRWQGFDLETFSNKDKAHYLDIIERLKRYADAGFYINDRKKLFQETRKQRKALQTALRKAFIATPKFAAGLGINPKVDDPTVLSFEVHELRRSLRLTPGGRQIPQITVELTQSRKIEVDGKPHTFFGGSTLVVDISKPEIKYRISKNINSKPGPDGTSRLDRTIEFLRGVGRDPLRELLFSPERPEPFAALHTLAEEEDFL